MILSKSVSKLISSCFTISTLLLEDELLGLNSFLSFLGGEAVFGDSSNIYSDCEKPKSICKGFDISYN